MRIVWSGNFDLSGFGRAAVDYVSALKKLGADVRIINRSGPTLRLVKLPLNTDDLEIKSVKKDDIHVQHVPPNDFKRSEAAVNIGYTTFESPKVPASWIRNLDQLDGILVPSEFNRTALVDHGLSANKVHVIPHIVGYLDLNPGRVEPFQIRNKKKFAFLSIIDFTYRKGWDMLLEAFWTEFRADENVSLVLKTYHKSFGKADRQKIKEHVLELKNKLKMKEVPSTLIYSWPIHDDLLPSFYKACQAYVFPSRGEGFSLTCAESMALEVPVVATHFGGHTDYMDYTNSTLVRYEGFKEMTDDELKLSPQYEQLPLCIPSKIHLREMMRQVYVHYDEAKERAQKGREDIKNRFSEMQVGVTLLDTIERIAHNAKGEK